MSLLVKNNTTHTTASNAKLPIPVIRRILQNIRTSWKDQNPSTPFSAYRKVKISSTETCSIQKFCFQFVANKYNRRHHKYLSKRKKAPKNLTEDETKKDSSLRRGQKRKAPTA